MIFIKEVNFDFLLFLLFHFSVFEVFFVEKIQINYISKTILFY